MESLLRRSCADQLRRAHSARRVRALILRVASLGRDAQNEEATQHSFSRVDLNFDGRVPQS